MGMLRQALWSPETFPPSPPRQMEVGTGPHHDLGWQKSLRVADHSLKAFFCLPVQVIKGVAQGAVRALQIAA